MIDFGWMMTLGLAVAFLITFIVFPALLTLLPPPLDSRVTSDRVPFTDGFARFTEHFGKTVLVGSGVIAVLCVIGVSKLSVENSFIDYFKSSTEIHQGMITIDRQRYLHVDVRLNHWVPEAPTESLLGIDLNAETPTRPHPPRIAIEPAGLKDTPPEDETAIDPAEAQAGTADLTPDNAETGQPRALIAGLNWPRAELLTWIREPRRMRSEEVHFLDAPTLGVLIFFKKIEPEDAAPLIRKLGLTGDQEPEESQEAP